MFEKNDESFVNLQSSNTATVAVLLTQVHNSRASGHGPTHVLSPVGIHAASGVARVVGENHKAAVLDVHSSVCHTGGVERCGEKGGGRVLDLWNRSKGFSRGELKGHVRGVM